MREAWRSQCLGVPLVAAMGPAGTADQVAVGQPPLTTIMAIFLRTHRHSEDLPSFAYAEGMATFIVDVA